MKFNILHYLSLTLLALLFLSSCDKDEISHIEYDGTWAIPISNSIFSVKELMSKFVDSNIYLQNDSTELISLVYQTSEKNITFEDVQKKFVDFDTVIDYNLSKNFPLIPGTGSYNFYYRDTLTFAVNDFTHGHNIRLDSLYFASGAFLCNIYSYIPQGWSWSCNVFSSNLVKDGGIFRQHLDCNDINKAIDANGYFFYPSNDSLYFVCDITLTVVGPAPAGHIDFDLNFGFKDIIVKSMYGDFSGLNYSTSGSSKFNFFSSSTGNVNMQIYDAKLHIPIVNRFGTPITCTLDYVTLSNDKGESKTLVLPETTLHINAPSVPGDSVCEDLVVPIYSDIFNIKPDKISYKITLTLEENENQDFFIQGSDMDLKLVMQVPLSFKVNTLEYVDTIHFNGFQIDKNKDIQSYVRACTLYADFHNAFPLGITTLLVLTDDSYNVLDTVFDDCINIKPCKIDSNGKCISPELSTISWNLNSKQINDMNDACNIFVSFKFVTYDDYDQVKIFSNEFFGLNLKSTIQFNDINVNK